MRIQAEGRDELGSFTLRMPGHCGVCNTGQDAVVVYNAVSLKRGLGSIDPAATIIADPGKKIKNIGVTCGCYAKFHRQVAHIKDRQREKRTRRSKYPTTAADAPK